MKKHSFTAAAITLVFALGTGLALLSSCEGPAGVPGEDANETCTLCHNDETLVLARMVQSNNSGHQKGTSFERNGTSCAPCHTHQGFLEVLATGEETTDAAVSNPLPANCRTCHLIHENYDLTDFALRTNEPVDLWINGVTVDLAGSGNSCVLCHQPRTPNPLPQLGGGNVTITSNRWGPHYGIQSSILWGTAGYEIPGTENYPAEGAHQHATQAGCNACHMAEPFGAFSGGHTFSMTYEYHGSEEENLAGCTGCHSTIEEFAFGDIDDIESMTDELKTLLENNGILNPGTGLVNASSSSPLVISSDQAGALMNYLMVINDGSMGVHNPPYTYALLSNSIDVFPQ